MLTIAVLIVMVWDIWRGRASHGGRFFDDDVHWFLRLLTEHDASIRISNSDLRQAFCLCLIEVQTRFLHGLISLSTPSPRISLTATLHFFSRVLDYGNVDHQSEKTQRVYCIIAKPTVDSAATSSQVPASNPSLHLLARFALVLQQK